MSEQLHRKPDLRKPANLASLPENREQAEQASKNRIELAKKAHDDASAIDKFLGANTETITVSLGKSKDGAEITGTVGRVNSDTHMLRVKVLENDQPVSDFAYGGLYNQKGHRMTYHVIEEVPTASGPDLEKITRDYHADRSLQLDGLNDYALYHGSDTVSDEGAMDFAMTSHVMARAAEQIEAQKGAQAA